MPLPQDLLQNLQKLEQGEARDQTTNLRQQRRRPKQLPIHPKIPEVMKLKVISITKAMRGHDSSRKKTYLISKRRE